MKKGILSLLILIGGYNIVHNSFNDNNLNINDDIIEDEDNIMFEYVLNKFKIYNPNIDTTIVEQFINVSNYFELDSNEINFKMFVGQILVESGAKQFVNGKVLTGVSGSIGMCQIQPNTCRGYLIKFLKKYEYDELINLGATDYTFINSNLSINEKNKLAKKWLSNTNNNIIMWGIITKMSLNENKNNIYRHFVAYNMGYGGMLNYIKAGGNLKTHSYVNKIKRKI